MTRVINRIIKPQKYTVVGNSTLLKQFSILFTQEGLKDILTQLKDGEDLRVTIDDSSVSFEGVSSEEGGDGHYLEDAKGKRTYQFG